MMTTSIERNYSTLLLKSEKGVRQVSLREEIDQL